MANAKIDSLISKGAKVATVVLPLGDFYIAEEYHRDYWNTKGEFNPYCRIIPGKLSKLRVHFREETVEG